MKMDWIKCVDKDDNRYYVKEGLDGKLHIFDEKMNINNDTVENCIAKGVRVIGEATRRQKSILNMMMEG